MMELQPSPPFPISIVSAEQRLTEVITAVMKRRTTFGYWERVGNQAELYLYDIHTPKKSSLNENLSFHFWKITLSEVNKLSREGKFMASVVSTFLRWGNICCCVWKPIRVRTGGFLFQSVRRHLFPLRAIAVSLDILWPALPEFCCWPNLSKWGGC